MDFSTPTAGELAWSTARDAKDEIVHLKARLSAIEEKLDGLIRLVQQTVPPESIRRKWTAERQEDIVRNIYKKL